jgi:phospholipid/cholesterol/gamma-HCH transport system ATP-binding protein
MSTAVELVDVHTALGGAPVLRGVSCVVPTDGITVMLGPSGAGKTTCLRHIAGLLIPDEGDVLVEQQSRLQLRWGEHLALSRRFGVLFEGGAMWGSLTVADNLVYQLRALTDLPEDVLRARALERLREVGLAKHSDVLPGQLSVGMRTRAALARALVSDPDFAVLDSVGTGVDPVRLGRLCTLIRWHRDTLGGSYLVTTHDMEVARRLADHVIVIWDGEVIEQGPAEAVFASPRPDVRQLLAGETHGPLALRTTERSTPPSQLPGEQWMELPIELATLVTLVAITGSSLFFGTRSPFEVALVAFLWCASATLIAKRLRRER